MRSISDKKLDEAALMFINRISLRQTSKITGIDKASLYRYFPAIKKNVSNPITICSYDEEKVGEFIGVFAGDGCFNLDNGRYRVQLFFNKTENRYADELSNSVLKELFGRLASNRSYLNKIILTYYSKNIYYLIRDYLDWDTAGRKTHSVHLKSCDYSREFKIGFLRGSLDSDGYFSDKKMSFASSSKMLIDNIMLFLKDLEIPFYYHEYVEKRPNRVNMHHVEIRKPYRRLFIDLINPRERKNITAPRGIRTPAAGLEGQNHNH